MSFPVTTAYALPLIVIWFALWMGVTSSRQPTKRPSAMPGAPTCF